MRTAGSMRIPMKRRIPLAPALVALGVAVGSIGAGFAWRAATSHEGALHVQASRATTDTGAGRQYWGFVLGSPVVEVLRHRPGLVPADMVRTSAFGWEGATVRDVLSDPVFVRELRLDPALSPLDTRATGG